MGPSFLEGGPIMYRCCPSVCLSVRPSVCPSVRLSVPCLHLEGKRKGLRTPNLVGRIPGTRAPRGPISRSKGQRSRSRRLIALLAKNPPPPKHAHHVACVVKSKWFTRWQHLLSPCGSTHVLNCKDGPIASSPSTAAHSCFNLSSYLSSVFFIQTCMSVWWCHCRQYLSTHNQFYWQEIYFMLCYRQTVGTFWELQKFRHDVCLRKNCIFLFS